jgi:hypothetical protein
MDLKQLAELLRALLAELEGGTAPTPTPAPKPSAEPFVKVRFRLLRAQYNRKLFPETYTEANPMGLYSGKVLAAIQRGEQSLNRESNAWLDLTAFREDGTELHREDIKRLKLGYETAFFVGNGNIIGNGQEDDGRPKPWDKVNPDGANISEETWRTSLGFTVRVHLSDEGEYECSGSVRGQDGESFTLKVS